MMRIQIRTTTAIYCPFCKSPFVAHGKPTVYTGSFRHESYKVECKSCGAIGLNIETWEIPNNKKEAKK